MLSGTVFQIYVVCSSILVFNLMLLAGGTALARLRAGRVLNPEDTKLNAKAVLQEVDDGGAARWRRAHLNALENILPFLPMGFLLVMVQPSVMLAGVLFGAFTLFRLVHSVAYIKELQPLRTISFAIGAFSLTGIVAVVLVKTLTA